jgi:hypothetical protein
MRTMVLEDLPTFTPKNHPVLLVNIPAPWSVWLSQSNCRNMLDVGMILMIFVDRNGDLRSSNAEFAQQNSGE